MTTRMRWKRSSTEIRVEEQLDFERGQWHQAGHQEHGGEEAATQRVADPERTAVYEESRTVTVIEREETQQRVQGISGRIDEGIQHQFCGSRTMTADSLSTVI